MGADIHMMVEYLSFTGHDGAEHWDSFGGRLNPGRDYLFFGILAGVRDEGQIFPLRGMPDNLSWDGKDYYADDDDLHSKTWLTYEEYAKCFAVRMLHPDGYGPPAIGYEAALALLRFFYDSNRPARLLIAFDN